MTFHHEHRFIAHKPAGLTTAEKLIGCYLSNRIVEKTNSYSISIRRLCTALELGPSTVKRSLKGLEQKQVFSSCKSQISTYARTFTMVLPCPLGCAEHEDHHTKAELLNSSNRVKMDHLSGQNEPPYIDIEEEEDTESFTFQGQEELGLLVTALNSLTKPTEAQKALKALTVEHPKQLAKDLLEMLSKAGVDSTRRKKSYLAEVVKNPSKALFDTQAKTAALDLGKELIINSPEDHFDEDERYQPAHTAQRLNAFINSHGKTTKVTPYINFLATSKNLNVDHLNISEALGEMLETIFKGYGLDPSSFDKQFIITADKHRYLPVIIPTGDGWINAVQQLPAEYIKTLLVNNAEHAQWTARDSKLQELKLSWLQFNLNPAPKQFERSPEMGQFIRENPLAISTEEISKRFLKILNEAIRKPAEALWLDRKNSQAATYKDYLRTNFGVKDDLQNVCYWIPERPEGFSSHIRKVEKEYRRLRSKLTHQEVIDCLTLNGKLTSGPEASQYAVSPEKYLADKCKHAFTRKTASNLEPLKA